MKRIPFSRRLEARRTLLGWTVLAVAPVLLLLAWLFRETSPWEYLRGIYFDTGATPFVYQLPAALALASILFAFVWNRLSSRTRIGISAAFTLLALLIFSGAVTPGLLAKALAGLLIPAAGIGAGEWLLCSPLIGCKCEGFDSPLERRVFCGAAGLGALALAAFLLGSLGWMPAGWPGRIVLWGALAGLALSALRSSYGGRANVEAPPLSRFAIALSIFTALLVFVHLPAMSGAPADYDVLEYHLAAPAQYLQEGRVSFLHENTYATFPQNGEMLFYLPMILFGGALPALPAAHAVLFSTWILSILAVYFLARRVCRSIPLWGESAAPLAGAGSAFLYVLIPLGSQTAVEFFVENIQALFHICAAFCGCAFLSDFKIASLFKSNAQSNPNGWLRAAGLFAGFACGTKYVALLFTLAPLLIFLPAFAALQSGREAVSALARIAIPAVLAICPWALRNAWAAGDPIFPLGKVLLRRIAGPRGVPDRLDHFEAAHRAGEISLRAAWAAALKLFPSLHKDSLLTDIESGPQLLFFAAPGFGCVVNAETGFLALLFGTDLLLWFLFSHRINRFVFPLMGPLAALGGIGLARLASFAPLRKITVALCCACIVLFAPIQMLWPWLYTSLAGENAARAEFAFMNVLETFEGWREVSKLPPGSKALFIGEARTFYCEPKPLYSVVFDTPPIESAIRSAPDVDGALRTLKERGITHLYVMYSEWWRLDSSYALSTDPETRRWERPVFDEHQTRMLYTLLRARRFKAYAAGWPENTFPAYLKLTPSEYERLETIFEKHTRVIWPNADDRQGSGELREIVQ